MGMVARVNRGLVSLLFGYVLLVGLSEALSTDEKTRLGNRIYTFGTIQLDPLYSQYGEGFIRNLTETVGSHLGLNYRIVSYSGNITGAWDNLVHTVANGEIDVGATLLTRTRCREELVSFTTPFLTSTLSALYHGNRGVVRTPEELLSSGFTLGTLNHSAITDLLADSTDTTIQISLLFLVPLFSAFVTWVSQHTGTGGKDITYKEILSAVLHRDENLVHTVTEGVERTRHSNYVFILDTVLAKYIASQRPCELKTLKLTNRRFQYGFIVRKGSPQLKLLSAAISELDRTGALQELVKKLIFNRKECGKIR